MVCFATLPSPVVTTLASVTLTHSAVVGVIAVVAIKQYCSVTVLRQNCCVGCGVRNGSIAPLFVSLTQTEFPTEYSFLLFYCVGDFPRKIGHLKCTVLLYRSCKQAPCTVIRWRKRIFRASAVDSFTGCYLHRPLGRYSCTVEIHSTGNSS